MPNTTVKIKASGKKVNTQSRLTAIVAKERRSGIVNAIWNGKEIEVPEEILAIIA